MLMVVTFLCEMQGFTGSNWRFSTICSQSKHVLTYMKNIHQCYMSVKYIWILYIQPWIKIDFIKYNFNSNKFIVMVILWCAINITSNACLITCKWFHVNRLNCYLSKVIFSLWCGKVMYITKLFCMQVYY